MSLLLTDRQRDLLAFIDRHLRTHGCGPSHAEVGRHLGVTPYNGAACHIRALERKDYIERPRVAGGRNVCSRAVRILRRRSGDYCLIGGHWYRWEAA